MEKTSKQPFLCLFTCLLSLVSAIPTALTPQENIFLRNSFDDSLLNSTLAVVVPSTFTINPSIPLDEPVLNRRKTLLLTLKVLGQLAIADFDEEQPSQTWHSSLGVAIDAFGPLMVIRSPLAMRKYVLWGLYKAVHLMVASDDFHPRNYELFSYGVLVGFVSYNNGYHGALGIGGGMNNGTGRGARRRSSSVLPSYLPNTTIIDLDNRRIRFGFELDGHRIGESNVFMTLFTGILKAGWYPKTDRVDEFIANTRTFNSMLSFQERDYPGPDGPFFEYEQLIQLLTKLPTWMITHGSRWTEAEMVVSVDDWLVGAGVIRYQSREGLVGVAGGNVSTS